MSEEQDVRVSELLWALWRGKWAILCAALLGAALFCAYAALFQAPVYRASVLFYISNTAESQPASRTSGDVAASEGLAETYTYVLTSTPLLDTVAKKGGLSLDGAALREMTAAETVEDAGLCRVEVRAETAEEAYTAAAALARYAPDAAARIITGSAAAVVEPPEAPTAPSSPSYPRLAATGLLTGLALAVCALLLRAAVRPRTGAAQ